MSKNLLEHEDDILQPHHPDVVESNCFPLSFAQERMWFQEKDLCDTGAGAAAQEQISVKLIEAAKQEFVLSEPGLLRVQLLQVAEREHVLALVMHHIIADGWSIGVLIRELKELYEACRE